ncbi:hypothetical protein [Alkalihalobacterium bogoriense]|uniref:hypothetical protein n=1 Tax=Alkalihalobacterium bogoriense TaxID=246272 RepID=UPI000687D715|nr:hypothetical protein [Alkalihalobacterium bogoriense]
MNEKSILIVGGYGVVGGQIAQLLREKYPTLPIAIAGRNLEKATEFANKLNYAKGVELNVVSKESFAQIEESYSLIISVVNDPENYVLDYAIKHQIALIDITRWPEKFHEAVEFIKQKQVKAPIILSSGWMAGLLSLCAKVYAEEFSHVEQININALYSLKDKAGPNSVEYIDQLTKSFTVGANEKKKTVMPLTDPVVVQFPSGYKTKTYRMDTPDHVTLPLMANTDDVNFRITFDNELSMKGLLFLVKTNIWKLISGDRFTSIRRSVLYHPGSGGPHQVVIDIVGTDKTGKAIKREITIFDPNGQTHLTTVAVVLQAIKIIEHPNWPGDLYFPEQFPETFENIRPFVETWLATNKITLTVKDN